MEFVPTVEEDLARRDFTVNAMAYSPIRGFADPFGGREDLKNGILRAVGDPAARFEEVTSRDRPNPRGRDKRSECRNEKTFRMITLASDKYCF